METSTTLKRKSARSRPWWRNALRWAIGLGATALSCWLLARDVDWQRMAQALRVVNYGWIAVGLLAIVSTFFTRARRWQALLWQSHVGLRPTITALLTGQIVNTILPMRSGDVVRAAWISPESESGTMAALGSIAIEKMWDLVALLACGLLLLIWMPLPDWFARSTCGTALTQLLAGGTLWAILRWQALLFRLAGRVLAYLPAGWDEALLPRLQRLADGLETIRQPESAAKAAAWTALTWAVGGMANLAVLVAFGIRSPIAALFLLAALMLGSAVPTPGKLGIFEGICVVVLGSFFDVPFHQALAVGLVLHVVVIGPPLAATALLTLWPRAHRRRQHDAA